MKIIAEEKAYQGILKMILSKRFHPGDRLVENELAEELKLSRTPVRNALKRLTALGLLDSRNNRGCYVPRLDPQDMFEIFESRKLIESYAAGEAAVKVSDEDIQSLENILQREKQCYTEGNIQIYTEINNEFHFSISIFARNRYVERFFKQAFWRSELYIFFFDRFYWSNEDTEKLLRDPSKSTSCQQHREIVNAILAGDRHKAEQAMSDHISSTYSNITVHNPVHRIRG